MIKAIVFLVALGIFIIFLDVRKKTRNCESKEEEEIKKSEANLFGKWRNIILTKT